MHSIVVRAILYSEESIVTPLLALFQYLNNTKLFFIAFAPLYVVYRSVIFQCFLKQSAQEYRHFSISPEIAKTLLSDNSNECGR